MSYSITILAGKVPYFYYKRSLKILYKRFLQKYRGYKPRPFELLMYGGHYGVSRSMIEGLKSIEGVEVNYNPSSIRKIYDTVIVIGGIEALRQAIWLKKKGKIKRLIAGPNIAVLPTDYREISSEHIDVYITHSDWCVQLFEDLEPVLRGKMRKWPAGVNEEYWKPQKNKGKAGKKIVFYKKRPEIHLYNRCLKEARDKGYEVTELIRGTYTFKDYKKILEEVDFLVHFVEQESQGISLSESWSMNVPTMVWNPGYWNYKGRNFKSSSAPFLCRENGRFFRDEKEFVNLLEKGDFNPELYSPRKWLLENLTDKRSAEILIDIIKNIDEK